MNIPFLRFFKKEKGRAETNIVVAPRPIVAIEKPASERLGRTFLPNVARIAEPEPETDHSASTAANGSAVMTAPSAVSAVALISNAVTPSTTLPPVFPQEAPSSSVRTISPGPNFGIGVARQNEPRAEKNERTIALPFTDLSAQIPDGMLNSLEVDPERRIIFKAIDIERGMASGRPSVPLRSVYQQAPELFSREVSPEDTTQLILPVAKVIEQFASFRVRSDQVHDPVIPQMETPFLKVTMEDSARFGTSVEEDSPSEPAVKTAVESPLPVSVAAEQPSTPTTPAPAAPLSAPSPVSELKPIKPIRLSLPSENKETAPAVSFAPPAPTVEPALAPRPMITPRFSPNGIGAPASERVPASSGPPVPTPLPSPFAPLPPTRLPIKIAPPSDDLRPPLSSTPVVMSANRAAVAGPRLQLPLLVVLRGIPSAQISGPTDEVPESAQIDVPLSIIQAQLSSGKISLSPAQFVAALPAEFRGRLKLEDSQTPIPLPLEEVLQRLPNDALRVRTDQEAPEPMTAFETPFSQKAAEDAARFQSPSTDAVVQVAPETPENLESNEESTATNDQDNAIADVSSSAADAKPMPLKPVLKITPEKTLLPGTSATSKPSESATPAPQPVERTPLQKIFETDEVLDPKSIVSHIGRLSGVRACAIMFSDGLSLADNFPPEYTTDALCAIAPTVVQKIGAQIPGAKLGALKSVTLFCAKEPVSFFAHETICLAALHAGANEMTSETRASLNAVVEELARIYTAQPNDVNQPNA